MSTAMEFGISLPRGPLRTNDRVIINFYLHNKEASPLYVNCRFAVAPKIGDVRLNIRKGNQVVPFKFRVRLQALKASDFLLLQPGESVIAGYELTKGFEIREAGEYFVDAEYISEEVPPELKNQKTFIGHLQATAERFSLS